MTENELNEFARNWVKENRIKLLGDPDKEDYNPNESETDIFGFVLKAALATIAENNRRLEEKLKKAGINI